MDSCPLSLPCASSFHTSTPLWARIARSLEGGGVKGGSFHVRRDFRSPPAPHGDGHGRGRGRDSRMRRIANCAESTTMASLAGQHTPPFAGGPAYRFWGGGWWVSPINGGVSWARRGHKYRFVGTLSLSLSLCIAISIDGYCRKDDDVGFESILGTLWSYGQSEMSLE